MPRWLRVIVWFVVVLLIGVPTVGVVVAVSGQIREGKINVSGVGLKPMLLVSSLAWATGISAVATLFAWPVAWGIRRHGLRMLPIVLLPLLAPSYLAYHSLGIHRAPLTRLGDVIEWFAKPIEQGGEGWTMLPTVVSQSLAVIGLALWAWPVAVLVLMPGLARLDQSILDVARLQGASWPRVQWEVLRLQWRAIVMAFGVVTLLMLGSAVPMHLAQTPTYAISAWQSIVLNPSSLTPWVASWPLFVLIFGLMAVMWRFGAAREEAYSPSSDDAALPEEVGRGEDGRLFARATRRVQASNMWTLLLLALSVVVPLVTYVISLKRFSSLRNFWMVGQDAVGLSVLVGGLVGVAGAALFVVSWAIAAGQSVGARCRSRRLSLNGLFIPAALLMIGALTPGIMVGHAWSLVVHAASNFAALEGVRDSVLPVVLAHLTRFAIIPVLAGAFFATLEPASLRDARTLAATSAWSVLRAWSRAELARGWGAVVGVGLAMACLSLHEVESSIVIQPAGTSSLPQTILAQLHFARQEEMAAAAVVVLGPAAVVACVAVVFVSRKRK